MSANKPRKAPFLEKNINIADYPVIITSEKNIFYTTNFMVAAKRPNQIFYNAVVIFKGRVTFICPQNWTDIASEMCDESVEIVSFPNTMDSLSEAIATQLEWFGRFTQIGCEMTDINLALYQLINKKISADCSIIWTDISDAMGKIQLTKTDYEISALKESAGLASRVMDYATEIICPGVSENEVVVELERFMRKNGSSGVPFSIKVLSGDNALKPRNLPTDKKIERGEIVLLDLGATLNGYASDWARSFAVCDANENQRELYDLVTDIEKQCIRMIRPGINIHDLYERATEIASCHKYGKYYNPFLGHSIGRSSVEQPTIVEKTSLILGENMVFNIEPGIYVPSVGGVRIEDMVLVTEDGYEIMTRIREEKFVI